VLLASFFLEAKNGLKKKGFCFYLTKYNTKYEKQKLSIGGRFLLKKYDLCCRFLLFFVWQKPKIVWFLNQLHRLTFKNDSSVFSISVRFFSFKPNRPHQ